MVQESSKEKGKSRFMFGIVVVVSCFLNFCPIGSFYSYGNMTPYVISYTRVKSIDPNKEIVEMNASPWLVGSSGVVRGFGCVLGGWVAGIIGPRPTAAVGSFIFTCSTFLTAFSLKLSFWAVIVTYGMFSGIGFCMCYMALVTTVTQWLPHHTGLGIGLIMMGLGGSSFAFIPLQTAFINPHDKEPNHQSNTYPEFFYFTQEDILERVPTMFIILGTIYVVFQLISIPFIVEYRDVELHKIIGHNVQYSDHVLAVIGSIASLSNCISRILLGHLADQMPCKVVLVLILGELSSFSYTFLATPIVSIWMFGVWIFVIFLCIGGSFSVLPTCCRSWYGQKHFSTNYGIIRSGSSIGSVISIIMSTYGYVVHWVGKGYFYSQVVCAFLVCLLL